MSDPVGTKVSRLSELPRDLPPPRDGWPALEARLRNSETPMLESERSGDRPASRLRPRMMSIAALAAIIVAVAVGVSIDRWILSPAHRVPQGNHAPGMDAGSEGLTVAYISDPRYLRQRQALLRSLDARLARLPPPARKKVLQSLAAIHQSMRDIQRALGREPGNALLQELLIDTYQNEMQVLSTVQEASGGGGET